MDKESKHKLIIDYRERLFINHCVFSLDQLFPHIDFQADAKIKGYNEYGAIIIDNRINSQWLFTIANTATMCPVGTHIYAVCDNQSKSSAQDTIGKLGEKIHVDIIEVEQIKESFRIDNIYEYSKMLKDRSFWNYFDENKLLISQTDALIIKPIQEFYFELPYLGAPFIPSQIIEIYSERNKYREIKNFYKYESAVHNKPNKSLYPNLVGNGGLSIRHRDAMKKLIGKFGKETDDNEPEDLFFSRYINQIFESTPIEIAQSFACEAKFHEEAIGNHACWKYFKSKEMAIHFENHIKTLLSMIPV
ncbi:DUF5672 family protein [Synechococcus sp. KORDI-100]|uniref:DUF5672 family protein n=1 Tax=Synechococcus sp. KORDI-100 TaxID=1280380 RepID=UPI00138E439B|nr:DUF5672 family protein [Synechococcus sp. KORDI-100]